MDDTRHTGHESAPGTAPARSRAERAFLRERLKQGRAAAVGQTGPALRAHHAERAPPSFAQQRMWFLQELAPGNPFYNIPVALPLGGGVDAGALERALNDILRRHEALRTVFRRIDGVPMQIVRPWEPARLDVTDLAALEPAEAARQLAGMTLAQAQQPFDLASGRLIRFHLVRERPDRAVLLLTLHHIAADGWSMGVLLRELTALYAAHERGVPADLPDLPVQYGDFALWQREQLSGRVLADLLAYWRGRLADLRDLPLLTDRPRPAMASFRGSYLEVHWDARQTEAARRLGHAHGCTLFQTVLAAFKAVLARFAGTDDITVGTPIANRTHPDIEPLIGFFVNSLALRTDLSGDPAFTDILARVRQTTLEAYAHQDLPFERLVEDIRPERDLSRNPLFQVSFQIQNAPGASDGMPALDGDTHHIDRQTAILDFAFSLWETQTGLVGGVEYASDLFDEASVRQITEAVRLVLAAAAADPSLRLSALPVMDARDRARNIALLTGARRAHAPLAMDAMFAAAVARHGGNRALADPEGEMTFSALDTLAGRIATAFVQAGITRGALVGLRLRRGRAFVAAMLALTRIGAAYLPLDRDLPAGRLAAIIRAARPALVLIEDDAPPHDLGPSARISRLLGHAATCAPLQQGDGPRPQDPCYVLFTSGSTGQPKGVVVPHRALANHMHWMNECLPLAADDVVIQRTPVQFDASVWEFWGPLTTGATLWIPPAFETADLGALLAGIAAGRPTVMQIVPSLLRLLLAQPDAVPLLSGLRRLCCGGERLDPDLVARIARALPQARIVNLYGPTEATIDASWAEVDAGATPVPIGRPVHNTGIFITDAAGALVPPGMRGEIVISGAALALGYLGRPEETAARFVHLPHLGGRAYRTGDRGWYRADGTLFCEGRLDHQVKLRGNRIELGEIEAVLMACPDIDEAAAILHEGEDGEAALAAFVTLRDTPAIARLRRQIDSEAVLEWEGLYEVIYGSQPPADASAPIVNDFTGWTSSQTGQPIPHDQMRRWADATGARIRALAPRSVFEIGCGTGLILSRIADACTAYVGCDLSAPVIARLGAWVRQRGLDHVHLATAPASAAETLPIDGCDTIILNSMVQYLPGARALAEVLAATLHRAAPQASVFIGDVRPLGLLRAFHAWVEAGSAPSGMTAAELRQRAETACGQEKELLFDPAWFRDMAGSLGVGDDVSIRLKDGADDNELVRYRYDVTIRRGANRPPAVLDWHNWRLGEVGRTEIAQAISSGTLPVAVTGIPNRRMAGDVALLRALADAEADTPVTALMAQAAQAARNAVDPAEFVALAAARGHIAELLPNRERPHWFDLVVHDGRLSGMSIDASRPPLARGSQPLANEPKINALARRLVPQWRAHMAEALPPAMVPARILILDRLPLLANGKLDRKALAALVPHRPLRETDYAAPEDALETLVAGIFADVLATRRVGRHDDFFAALGGHSLLATQAIARLREVLGQDVPLRLLFQHPTPARLAEALAAHRPDARDMAGLFLSMQDLDEAALDALLAQPEGGPA